MTDDARRRICCGAWVSSEGQRYRDCGPVSGPVPRPKVAGVPWVTSNSACSINTRLNEFHGRLNDKRGTCRASMDKCDKSLVESDLGSLGRIGSVPIESSVTAVFCIIS